MHLLAHALCGDDNDLLIVGQLAGDYVRGRDLSGYPGDIGKGIWQHRRLDSYTDQHAIVRRSRVRLVGPKRRYAGILVDLAYGHLLARNWADYGQGSLLAFERRVHDLLAVHHDHLPKKLQSNREGLRKYRVLSGIGDADGVMLACNRLSHRLPGLVQAHEVVLAELDNLALDFDEFWPKLRAYSRSL